MTNSISIKANKYNPLYFFNNQYNDTILRTKLGEYKDLLYTHAIKTQSYTQQSNFISGSVGVFKIDRHINTIYKLPVGTFTYSLPANGMVPLYERKTFIDNYDYEMPISLITIMNNPKVFKSRLMFNIGNYVFLNLKVIFTEFGSMILCIYPSSTDGITANKMKEFFNSKVTWCLYTKPHSDNYGSSTLTLNNLFGVSNSFIRKDKFSMSNEIHKPSVTDKYDICITGDLSNPNLLNQSYAVLTSENGVEGFSISPKIKELIKGSINPISCYIINDYRRIGSYQYNVTVPNSYLCLPVYGNKNPISSSNIIGYSYDSINALKKSRFSINKDSNSLISLEYPNVFSIGPLAAGNYVFDYYESDLTMSVFDNNFSTFESFMNKEFPGLYGSSIITRDLPIPIKNYIPNTKFTYDYPDYFNDVDTFGDIRAYNLKKCHELIEDNPIRYLEYTKDINDINKKFVTYYQNLSNDSSLYNRTVIDTSDFSVDNKDIITFTEDQLYIEFNSTVNINMPCLIFIDGKRISPTLIKTKNHITRAYFPKSKCTTTSKVSAEMIFASENDQDSIHTALFNPLSVNTPYKFSNYKEFGMCALTDLIFYNAETMEYIDPANIDFTFDVDQYLIDHPVDVNPDIYFGRTPDIYLLTNDGKYYRTNASEYVVLQEDRHAISGINLATSTIELNKPIDFKYLSMSINSPTMINMHIGISTTNFFKEFVATGTIGSATKITIPGYKGSKNNEYRIFTYSNGKLLPASDYIITFPKKYGGDLTIDINPQSGSSGSLEFNVIYIPYNMHDIYKSNIKFDNTNQGLINLATVTKRPFDIRHARIYKNGYLVPEDDIIQTPIMDTIKINNLHDDGSDYIEIEYDNSAEMFNAYAEDTYNALLSNDVNYQFCFINTNHQSVNYTVKDGMYANYIYNLHGTQHAYITGGLGEK